MPLPYGKAMNHILRALLASLIGYGTGCFTRRLTRGLTFATASTVMVFLVCACAFKYCFDVCHWNLSFQNKINRILPYLHALHNHV